MAEIFVKHTLNPRKAIKVNLNLRKYVLTDTDGEAVWLLEAGTTEPDKNGFDIPPKFVHKILEANIEDEINKIIADICDVIDWGEVDIDRFAPIITDCLPSGDNALITSKVTFTISEDFPASGVDLSDMVVLLNNGDVDFDITSEVLIQGDPYKYFIYWEPTIFYG